MIQYLLKRMTLFLSIIFSVHVLTFFLFFTVFSPQDLALAHLGEKGTHPDVVESWILSRGLEKPLLYNNQALGIEKWTQTLFCEHTLSLLYLSLGQTLSGEPISQLVQQRVLPSLLITAPQFIITFLLSLFLSFKIFSSHQQQRGRLFYFLICAGLSISPLFFLLFAQKVLAIDLKMMPMSGYDQINPIPFILLPNIAGVLAGLSGQSRWFIGLMRQQLSSKNLQIRHLEGMPSHLLIDQHLFKQSLVPIVTSMTVAIPLLITGSLLLETFFSLPGLGSLSLEALASKDIFLLRAMTIIGVSLYCVGLLLTDLLYVKVDPRIRLD